MSRDTVVIGLDDTDHPTAGCTTDCFDNLLNRLIESNHGFRIVSRRLVRLWPFAPRRTRGNGALSAVIELESDTHQLFLDVCKNWFEELLDSSKPLDLASTPSSPVLIISDSDPPLSWYKDTVRGLVELESRLEEIEKLGIVMFSGERKWGAIGASAAIAWSPENNSTWE